MRFAILYVLIFTFYTNVISQVYQSSNINLLSVTKPGSTSYSGCWGWYQANKNREYALIQGFNGNLYFIDVTIPTLPVICDSVKGDTYFDREVATYQNFCYSISSGSYSISTNCFQIIDMSYLPDSVHVNYTGNSYFTRSHTLFIDNANLYLGAVAHGTLYSSMEVYSLSTPTSPSLIGRLDDDYPLSGTTHDMFVRNDTVFASQEYVGLFIYKFTGTNFIQLGSLSNYAESGYCHSSCLSKDGKSLVFTDEAPKGLSIKLADVTNLNNPQIKALFKPNNYSNFVAHNPYVLGNKWAIISCYQDGLNIYDISNPNIPKLAGYFDTYPQAGANTGTYTGGYTGNWGAYPYFPSGNILASDMTNGAFMLQMAPTIGLTEHYENQTGILIHQNPISEFVSFELKNKENGSYTALLKDALGKIVLSIVNQFDPANCNRIEVSEIPNGVYFLSIIWKGKQYQQKIVISH